MDMQVRDLRTKGGTELPAFVWGNLLDKHTYTAFIEYEIVTVYCVQMLGSIMG
jgi:hypothetical protein